MDMDKLIEWDNKLRDFFATTHLLDILNSENPVAELRQLITLFSQRPRLSPTKDHEYVDWDVIARFGHQEGAHGYDYIRFDPPCMAMDSNARSLMIRHSECLLDVYDIPTFTVTVGFPRPAECLYEQSVSLSQTEEEYVSLLELDVITEAPAPKTTAKYPSDALVFSLFNPRGHRLMGGSMDEYEDCVNATKRYYSKLPVEQWHQQGEFFFSPEVSVSGEYTFYAQFFNKKGKRIVDR